MILNLINSRSDDDLRWWIHRSGKWVTSVKLLIDLFFVPIIAGENLLRDVIKIVSLTKTKNVTYGNKKFEVINLLFALYVECEIVEATVACFGFSSRWKHFKQKNTPKTNPPINRDTLVINKLIKFGIKHGSRWNRMTIFTRF